MEKVMQVVIAVVSVYCLILFSCKMIIFLCIDLNTDWIPQQGSKQAFFVPTQSPEHLPKWLLFQPSLQIRARSCFHLKRIFAQRPLYGNGEKISEKGKSSIFHLFLYSSVCFSTLSVLGKRCVFWRSEMPFARCTKNPCLLALPEMSRIFLLFRPSSSFFSCLKTSFETRPSSFFGRCESICYTFCARTAHTSTHPKFMDS